MDSIERETAISSLTHLESYYQSRYEHYLAMATEAKEHREHVYLLLQDLMASKHSQQSYWIESSPIIERENHRSIEARNSVNGLSEPLLSLSEPTPHGLEETSAPMSSSTSTTDEFMEKDAEQMRKFLQTLSKAMSVIESVANLEAGKTLHQSYLHKILNYELDTDLNQDLVQLYLEEAIARKYLELDEFDSKCYIAKSSNKIVNDTEVDRDRDVDIESPNQTVDNNSPLSKTPKLYNLPPSPKLKPTLFETLAHYIDNYRPKRFSIDDILNYLYSSSEQLNWSKERRNKIRSCISNVLGRKAYLGKHWSRIKPGIYRPLPSN